MPISPSLPIVIVGAGPVGLTLAACLAALNVPSLVVDRRTGAGAGSRAICLSRRTLEILAWAGCAEAVAAESLGWRSGRTYFGRNEVHRLEMPHDADQRWLPMYNLQQHRLEELLEKHCAATGLIEMRCGVEVRSTTEHAEGVRLTCNGATPTIEASWLAACDGARSVIRSACGLRLEGQSYAGRYLIADIHLASDHPTERRLWFAPEYDRRSTVIMHRQPGDIWRIDYQLVDGESDEEALRPDSLRQRIAAHLAFIGEAGPWRLIWSSIYQAHTLALPSYRHGRVLFAGDAAHLVPIFGVRGLNSGMVDAHNLAWKLARVAAGTAPDRLLDSYSSERRGATLDIFRQAAKTTRFVTPATRGDRLLRDAALSLAVDQPFVRPLIDPRQSTVDVYHASPLNAPDPTGPDFTTGPAPGELVREQRHAGGWLQECLGRDFAFLTMDQAFINADVGGGRPVIIVRPSPHLAADTTYLVRPDGHVAARWRGASSRSIDAAMRRAVGA